MSKSFVTTVKLDSELYDRFKEINVRAKISLQDFVNKCIDTYITDEKFRNEVSESIVKNNTFSPPSKNQISDGNNVYTSPINDTGTPLYKDLPTTYSSTPQRNIAGEPIR